MVDRFNLWLGRVYAAIQDDEDGQSMAEYALILALIAVVAITALTALGGNIGTKFNSICSSLKGSSC
jgi:pilus assembly protein Flp/PilA